MSCKIEVETFKKGEEVKKEQAEQELERAAMMNISQKTILLQKPKFDGFSAIIDNPNNSKSSNQVDMDNRRQGWTVQEESKLFQLHNQKGNRWVEIARQLNRNDNSVKNHYHSKFRKTLRKINKFVIDHLKGQQKPIKNTVISKVIQTAEELYSESGEHTQEQVQQAYNLKNRILSMGCLQQQQVSTQQIVQINDLVREIENFTKEINRRHKSQGEIKTLSNRYKGKQIRSLLTQNSKNKLTNSNQPIPKTINITNSVEEREQLLRERRPSEVSSLHTRNQTADRQYDYKGSSCYQPYFFFNEGLYPIGTVLYPVYPQNNNLFFSGHLSSFSTFSQPLGRRVDTLMNGNSQAEQNGDQLGQLRSSSSDDCRGSLKSQPSS